MNQPDAKRDHYLGAALHLKAAERELVDALGIARAAQLKFIASIEKLIAAVEKVEAKFNKESGRA